MTVWIIPLCAGWKVQKRRLVGDREQVIVTVDEAGARNCKAATTLLKTIPGARICTVTGFDKRKRVLGKEVIRAYLLNECQCSTTDIEDVDTDGLPFRTVGEMEAFARMLMQEFKKNPEMTGKMHTVYIVGRWWHVPRAKALLRKQLGPLMPVATIETISVPSLAVFDMARELLLAWPKALLFREI